MTWPLTGGMEWFQTKMGLYGAVGPIGRNGGRSESRNKPTLPTKPAVPCPAYQLNNCSNTRDHDGLKHICAYHYKHFDGRHLRGHGEADCKIKASFEAKSGAAKNGPPPGSVQK